MKRFGSSDAWKCGQLIAIVKDAKLGARNNNTVDKAPVEKAHTNDRCSTESFEVGPVSIRQKKS